MVDYVGRTAKTVLVVGAALCMCLVSATVFADQSQSANYQVNETFFGTGGELNACSGSYCSKQSAGELTVGNTKSSSYQAQAGFNTNREESLQLIISSSAIDLGVQSVAAPGVGTAKFIVKSYLSSGYIVQINGPSLTSAAGRQFAALGTQTASTPGTEQFGINLTTNTSPAIPGSANPVQLPDGTFSFGSVTDAYNDTNVFRYVNGDTIAQSMSSSGTTEYTISYMSNISATTGSGLYTANHSLVATATF